MSNARIKNTETINITGNGNNILKLAASNLLDLSSTSNTLRVDGNAGDRVQAVGFTDTGGVSGELHRYVSGTAVLLVETDVTVVLM